MTTKNLLFITGTRSDFASIKFIISEFSKTKKFRTKLFVTGPHTLKKAGYSYKEIKKLGFKIDRLESIDGKNTASDFIKMTSALDAYLGKNKFEAVIICGDRPEMLAGAVASLFQKIPVFHIHGGDVTYGMTDDNIRHAITKLSSIHFAASAKSADRISRMGEEKWRVFKTGSPDIDELASFKSPEQRILSRMGLKNKKFSILLFHPETLAEQKNYDYAKNIVIALKKLNQPVVVIHPTSDPYAELILSAYKKFMNGNFHVFPSLDRTTFLTLLKNCSFLIGNSSGGIIEAATFKVPVINLGHRQDGRQRNMNTIDVPEISENSILKALKKTRSRQFKILLEETRNVYGKGNSCAEISKIVKKILDKYSKKQLLYKRFII